MTPRLILTLPFVAAFLALWYLGYLVLMLCGIVEEFNGDERLTGRGRNKHAE
jgi:hypothetical protein